MDMLEDLLKTMMKFLVDLIGVSTTEIAKGSYSLQTVLIWLLETLVLRRTMRN